MEQLEIHSKSYLVRWVDVSAGHTISWSLQPHKKSINFGLFKHPGQGRPTASTVQSIVPTEQLTTPPESGETKSRRLSSSAPRTDNTTVIERLHKLGIKSVTWTGKCAPDTVSMGSYNVLDGQGGMYGLVFDNTHSKQFSKTVTFALMTFATAAPPKSGHHLHFSSGMARASSFGPKPKPSPQLLPISDSHESLPQVLNASRTLLAEPSSRPPVRLESGSEPSFHTGTLSKKRRKKNQGWAKRFFSLDYTSATLSYYKNRHSSALRGAIPLSLAAIAADETARHISIDSGTEIWLLRAPSQQEFDMWKDAIEKASLSSPTPKSSTAVAGAAAAKGNSVMRIADPLEVRDWDNVETLVGRVAGITDAVRRLAKDTDPKYAPGAGVEVEVPVSFDHDIFRGENQEQADSAARAPFWRRKSSTSGNKYPPGTFKRTLSAKSLGPGRQLSPSPQGNTLAVPKRQSLAPRHLPETTPKHLPETTPKHLPETSVHDHCMAVLRDLDSVVAQFSTLLGERKSRRSSVRPQAVSRNSIDSTMSQEFFDAEEGQGSSTLLTIRRASTNEGIPPHEEEEEASLADDSNSSSGSEAEPSFDQEIVPEQNSFFPSRPKNLTPLPTSPVTRRTTIPPSSGPPPSLISFLRKNVGKDLSTVAMPVTSNEPLSLLQRQSEQLEYSNLLDTAASLPADASNEAILYMTAFAISGLSASRVKERAVRKPFNPLLGETYELLREDRGFRFLAEKVTHRPCVRIACAADADRWSFATSPAPTQKFWGKSAELITEGRARVVLRDAGGTETARYSWTPATCALRNLLAGEKYIEPVGTLTVHDETSGMRAVATFKAGGMFSGRSEEVSVVAYTSSGTPLPLGLAGTWTAQLSLTSSAAPHRQIWSVGTLVPSAQTRYGLTSFAAQLNEISALEAGRLPVTDSRLRPDQRAYEDGDVDEAESVKAELEEGQRRRRREMEEAGEAWTPRWFVKVGEEEGSGGGEEVWMARGGAEGYWAAREAGRWEGVKGVF